MYRVLSCLNQQHDYRLVILAAAICATATFTAFTIYAHVLTSSGFRRLAWTTLTGVCTASGIWATHFVAMLAYDAGLPTNYEPVATVGSLLVAMLITAAGFYTAARSGAFNVPIGGAIIGAGIGAMHYTGMSAVLVPGTLTWDLPSVAGSLIIGIALTSIALVCYHKETGLKATAIAAVIFTVAICGLHFTAMGALTIVPDPTVLVTASSFDTPKLALAVAAVTSILSMSGLAAVFIETEARKQRETVEDEMRRTSDELVQESNERRRLFETSLDLIFITDRQGNFIRVSPSSMGILGYQPEEMIGRNAAQFVYPDDLAATRLEMHQARAGLSTRNFETRYKHRHGRIVSLAWSGVWSEPEQKHFFVGRDMTERKLAEEKLRKLAHYDQLTGLPNRVTLRTELSALLTDRSPDQPVTVAMFDLDGFKDINDTLGHSSGDCLLQAVAGRVAEILPGTGARMYRVGGDEFVMVLPHGDPLRIGPLMNLMLQRLGERFEIAGQGVFVGASAGIAMGPRDGEDVESLISNADLALYDAKAAGGRTYRLFQPTLRADAQARRALDAELRRAFSEGEFCLHYQPQLRLSDGAVVGAEALLRWQHPERGLLGPAVFIDALARSVLAMDVGRWILHTACGQAAAWRAGGQSIRIGVNLFPAQFHEQTLFNDVEAALQESGLPPDLLELEITENIALSHHEAILSQLTALRERGVGLAFDDFGTGYASLSYLTRYPLSRIKIDRSFVKRIGVAAAVENGGAIVRAIIVMAHHLGLQVTAEGVESAFQATFLRTEKCNEVQGFYYAKPISAAELLAFARAGSGPHVSALAG